MPSLPDFPGYLGLSSKGVVAIHADWPAYPVEHGSTVALETLGQFQSGSELIHISEIDQCLLFVLANGSAHKDPFDNRHLHAAVWREDLHDLHSKGFVSGTYEIGIEQWIDDQRAKLTGHFWKDSNGEAHPVRLPTIEDFDGDTESSVLMFRDTGIAVTRSGWAALELHLSAQKGALHPSIGVRVARILEIPQFDTAIREACLLIEVRIRDIIGSDAYGQPLVTEFDTSLRATAKFLPSQLKTVNLDIRTAFKFVRNPYMHGLHEMTSVQCYALLSRLSRVLVMLDQIQDIFARSADEERAV